MMRIKIISLILILMILAVTISGCKKSATPEPEASPQITESPTVSPSPATSPTEPNISEDISDEDVEGAEEMIEDVEYPNI